MMLYQIILFYYLHVYRFKRNPFLLKIKNHLHPIKPTAKKKQQNNNNMGSKEQWGKAVAGARATTTAGKGALIMKTVSLLLASSRRVTLNNQKPLLNDNQIAQAAGAAIGGSTKSVAEIRKARRKAKQRKMDEAAGKLNPKLLEIYKKKTHFSKYV